MKRENAIQLRGWLRRFHAMQFAHAEQVRVMGEELDELLIKDSNERRAAADPIPTDEEPTPLPKRPPSRTGLGAVTKEILATGKKDHR